MKTTSFSLFAGMALLTIGCAAPKSTPSQYAKFRAENPRSILIVPVVNRTVDVTAAACFLSTISRPVAERGYYVYPVFLVQRLLEDDGLADAALVHQADPRRLGQLFGSDAILYVTIDRWDAKYLILDTTVEVEFHYALKSGTTGEELWSSREAIRYSPTSKATGSPLADLFASALAAGLAKAAPNYIALAQEANGIAVSRPHRGLPAGPYSPSYQQDFASF